MKRYGEWLEDGAQKGRREDYTPGDITCMCDIYKTRFKRCLTLQAQAWAFEYMLLPYKVTSIEQEKRFAKAWCN